MVPNSSSGHNQQEKPDRLICLLRPGEHEFIAYHFVHKPAPPGWEHLMALGGHLWRAALIRKIVE